METNNLEKKIQQKLQNREIQPSASAWERLSHQLENQEKKKKKGWFLYMGYAASILLIISLFFFLSDEQTNETAIPENTIVKEDISIPEINTDKIKEVIEQEDAIVVNPIQKEEKLIGTKKELRNKLMETNNLKETVIAQKSVVNKEKPVEAKVEIQDVIRQKEEMVIAKTIENKNEELKNQTNFKKTNSTISVDSDALLYAVTHSKEEIKGYYEKYKISRAEVLKTIESELKKSKLKIDPNTILAEVEKDVNEESFKNNFYQLIKKRVSDVAVAIANRNN